ncbi:MAG: CCA tRNA nucleotidyltransferase [Verrucomicrobia bacterium]|nr:CCA tRNA nucleotidyltransferase [Verrucomicrobiota bacterium]
MSLRATATTIAARLQQAGHAAFFVGGSVRDQLLGKEPHDFDIATGAKPDEIEALFRKTIPVGKKFGVIIVREGGHEFQVATFRAEADYRDGRRPEHVEFTDAVEDARRRDFTINGLFLEPVTGKLHDWVGGEADLKARVIRTIGAPAERFAEDYLRLLRAVRLAAQLGFEIEAETFAALQAHAEKISGTAAERVREELMKLFRPPHAARGLRLLRASGLLRHVLPEVEATVGCEQSADHHPEGTVFEHLCLMLEQLPADAGEELPWAVLMHDIAKPLTASRDAATGAIHFYGHEKIGAELAETILRRLKFPRQQIEDICAAVLHHMQFKDVLQMRKATLRRMILRETFPLEMALHRADCLGSHRRLDHYEFVKAQAEELARQPQLKPPLLNGADLMALGVAPGPRMGELLHELRDRQLAEELKTAEEAKEWVKQKLAAE